jgi:exodeoxyribonuclease V beta subunit
MTVKNKTPDILFPLQIPMTGRSLIEASAGTGKTYTLAFLYVRLLLGIGEQAYHRPLTVDEILVVTFTNAATEELRYRIRENIHQLRIACLRGYHTDSLYQQLLDLIDDPNYAAQTLRFAEQQMDEAAIYTIHGFCQRILTTNAFESGILFNQQVVQDDSQLCLQVVQDFWRRFFYPLSAELVCVIEQVWKSPQQLYQDLVGYLYNTEILTTQTINDKPIEELIVTFHNDKITKICQVKQLWQQYRDEIESLIAASDINKKSYSRRNLTNWLQQVDEWAVQETNDYYLTSHLQKFAANYLADKSQTNPPKHPLFTAIETLCNESFNLKYFLLFPIAKWVQITFKREKQQRAEMGYNDLLHQLHHALINNHQNQLAKSLARRYPVAMIDEFQDTDTIQYQIFDRIYPSSNSHATGLLFIGDPKQAIYAFRGADIFTYIRAKQYVEHYYTMEINWRSSADMIAAVNQLFDHQTVPFIFNQIPFINVKAAKRNDSKSIELQGDRVKAMHCYLLPADITTVTEYRHASADYCAQQIYEYLAASRNGQAWLVEDSTRKRAITSADMAILVRNGDEAEMMQQALSKRGIRSVYLSNRRSVFASEQAKELLWLLQAVLNPENDRYIHTALATQLLATSMSEIDGYNHDQDRFEEIVEEFQQYRYYWERYGVLVMLRRMITQRHMAENILMQPQGERILTNLLHLGEQLQQASEELDSQHALLRWLIKQIQNPNPNLENQQQRLENDDNLVKIITIFKAKGLEYPIVYLPFICHHRAADKPIYHDRQTYAQKLALLNADPQELALIEEERLAEDLRLLYVAMTRSIYQCTIGIAGLKTRKGTQTILEQTALGYLLQKGEAGDYDFFKTCLLSMTTFDCKEVELNQECESYQSTTATRLTLTANSFKRQLHDNWQVSSFSSLQQSNPSHLADIVSEVLSPSYDIEVQQEQYQSDSSQDINLVMGKVKQIPLSMHTLPKGAHVGTLFHQLMEQLNFQQPQTEEIVAYILARLTLNDEWQPFMCNWINDLLQIPLSAEGLALNQICSTKKLIELPFYLPIRRPLSATQLNQLCKQYDPLSRQCGKLTFATIEGMLKGFIDLVFEWQGRFYIIDYKSNWLGDDEMAYTQPALEKAMCQHRYDLQYQLYSLALHRYLQQRLPDYDYHRDFGGVYYLFLRGMSKMHPQNGIFYYRPDQRFIEELDTLFN